MDLKVSDILAAQFTEIQKVPEKKVDTDFSFTLNKLDEEHLVTRLTGLIDEITVKGDELAKHMDIKDLKDYRKLVTDFVSEVVTNSHKFTRENFLDRRGRHRVYGIVKLVNKNLDDLAQEVLKKEKDHLAILAKTDEIRGLLVDILV